MVFALGIIIYLMYNYYKYKYKYNYYILVKRYYLLQFIIIFNHLDISLEINFISIIINNI